MEIESALLVCKLRIVSYELPVQYLVNELKNRLRVIIYNAS